MPIDLSVVVGSIASERSIQACLASVAASCTGLRSEIIVVDASTDETASIVQRYFPEVNLIRLSPGTLTPVLWSTGVAAARGSRVATTTGHCIVPAGWARDLTAALNSGAAGAGGPIALRADASLVDRAIYLLRYSSFLPKREQNVVAVSDIAGDNAMYERSVLDEHRSSLADGFWEVEVHRALRAKSQSLVMVQSAAVEFGRSFPLPLISRHRFAHGRRYGAWRVREHLASAPRIVLAAPAVPLVLLARIAQRVIRSGEGLGDLFVATPVILWLAACWAFGEALGAIQSGREQHKAPEPEAARAHRD